jgi:DNA (cytosine-5)-methyltransferase 1
VAFSHASLFSGAGGLNIGLEASGFETRFCVDNHLPSCQTLRLNKQVGWATGIHSFLTKATIVHRDVHHLNGTELMKIAGTDEIDLISGGPPCQPFSISGRRKGVKDPRGGMIWEFLRIIAEVRPKAFIMENVPGIVTVDKGRPFVQLVNQLQQAGGGEEYRVRHFILDVVNYGVPQYRRRVIIVGNRLGRDLTEIPPTHGQSGRTLDQRTLRPIVTVARALSDLPPPGEDSPVPNHVGRVHSSRIVERYASLAAGERDDFTQINKLDLQRPSFTIVVGSDHGGGKGHIHPLEPREVTPRESARIQTFPDWWIFSGTRVAEVIRQVGNAVPPLFAAAVGVQIISRVFGSSNIPSFEETARHLGQEHLLAPSAGSSVAWM